MHIKTPITIAHGDGIGPEIMQATLKILTASNARIIPEVISLGKSVYLQGNTSGIPADAWSSLKRTKVLLKAPITTPQGGGYKSLNVTLRKTLGLFANIRSSVAYTPYVASKFPNMNLVVIRENEEDLYTGIEHRATPDVYECLKLVSRSGCEKIIRYAFEYTRQHNRKKLTCMTKDNIMKMTDGVFHQIFDNISQEYPDIATNHYIIDIGSALIATNPEHFDVIVTTNLYGDIISDIAAQVAGSVGLSGSANIGKEVAMFEAIHGSAPDIAGKNVANPSGLINAAIQMLVHIAQPDIANLIANAWLCTLEDGIHTSDIYNTKYSTTQASTTEFAAAVIKRLGSKPQHFAVVNYQAITKLHVNKFNATQFALPELVGVDIAIANHHAISALAARIHDILQALNSPLQLTVIASKGLEIWPKSVIEQPYLEYCTCRFQADTSLEHAVINYQHVLDLSQQLYREAIAITKIENLYNFAGEPGFTLFQGQ